MKAGGARQHHRHRAHARVSSAARARAFRSVAWRMARVRTQTLMPRCAHFAPTYVLKSGDGDAYHRARLFPHSYCASPPLLLFCRDILVWWCTVPSFSGDASSGALAQEGGRKAAARRAPRVPALILRDDFGARAPLMIFSRARNLRPLIRARRGLALM